MEPVYRDPIRRGVPERNWEFIPARDALIVFAFFVLVLSLLQLILFVATAAAHFRVFLAAGEIRGIAGKKIFYITARHRCINIPKAKTGMPVIIVGSRLSSEI